MASQDYHAEQQSEKLHVYLFGDQTAAVEVPGCLKILQQQTSQSSSLRVFLGKTVDILQGIIANLSYSDRKHFPGCFQSVLDLAEFFEGQNGFKDVVLSTVLLCISQIGSLIIEAENDPFLLVPSEARRCIFGVCTGSLAAAAAAVSNSVKQLVDIGPEIVCISLRTGLEAYKRSQRLESSEGSWTLLVVGLSAVELQTIIDEFNKSNSLPTYLSVYISAFSNDSSTLSAPPTALRSLLAFSTTLAESSKQELPISAAFHAPHLQKPDYGTILGSSPILDLPLGTGMTMASTGSSACFDSENFKNLGELLTQGLDDIFQIPLYWSKTVQGISGPIVGSKTQMSLTSFGPNALTKSFLKIAATAGATNPSYNKPPPMGAHSKLQSVSDDIAVVGMAGRFPGADDLEEFWRLLKGARDLHKEIPKDRFDINTYYDPSGTKPNTTASPFGCFIENPGLFDSRLFRMSPREAKQTDPIQRMLLLSTYEALEMAGYSRDECGSLSVPPSMRGERIGTFFGQTTDDWRECNAGQDIDNFYVPGGMRAFGPGRLNYWFKWEGPSYSIDTACSSSSAAIEMACASLIARKCDTAVAGGGNILSGPGMYAGLSKGGFLSPTGNCKTFSDEADGYCRGDGVGVVVLKRLQDAIADNDNIQGVIKSVETNHSAHAVSITHPHAATQVKLYKKVLRGASVAPSTVQYVEMHGTGTQAGDSAEMESVMAVFGKECRRSRPLYVGSVKANVGHGEAAAGVTSLIKTLLMFRNLEIPPHPMTGSLNRKFSLTGQNISIASSPVSLKDGASEPARVLINNFNATGGNTAMLLEGPPIYGCESQDPRSHHVVAISASTSWSLRQNLERLSQYLLSNPSENLADLAYTTTARKMHHGLRKAFAVSTIKELTDILARDLQVSTGKGTEVAKSTSNPSVAFVFTGQGSHFAGMGKQLFDTCSSFKGDLLEFESTCIKLGFPTFINIITNPTLNLSSASAVQTQLATVSIELAIARLWQAWGVRPSLVIGHSLGEYVAMQLSGVLSLNDMFYLVGKRAELVLEKCSTHTHSMLAIKTTAEYVQEILHDVKFASCAISCFNSPLSVVVSGPLADIQLLKTRLHEAGTDSVILNVPFAFHSDQVKAISKDFQKLAEDVRFAKPSIPIASSLLGTVVADGGIFSPGYLVRHASEQVNFVGAVQACQKSGLTNEKTIWIESGPGSGTVGMVKATVPFGLAMPTIKSSELPWKTISKTLASIYGEGVSVDWPEYHKEYKSSLRLLELPTYAFDLKNYWIQFDGTGVLTKDKQATHGSNTSLFSTTCLQRVETEKFSENTATVTFVSDLHEETLLLAIRGHLVCGIALCPSSVYSDMAFTAASYVASKSNPSTQLPAMDLHSMEVFHPLVVSETGEDHRMMITATRSPGSPCVRVIFSSQKGSSDVKEHAHCTVSFGDGKKWIDEWSRNSYLVSERRDSLFHLTTRYPTHKVLGSMVYKLFSTLVHYSAEYRCLTEVFMCDKINEAAARLKFIRSPEGTVFTYSPYWIDSIVHLAGFVLNGHVTTHQDEVYISHGWESLKIAAPLSEELEYTSYVRMQPVGTKGLFVGDVSLFHDDQIVVTCSGLKFQRMKKSVLLTLLNGSPKQEVRPKISHDSTHPAPHCWPSVEHLADHDYWLHGHHNSNSRRKTGPKTSRVSGSVDATVSDALKIVAAEIGVGIEDLTDVTTFEELGVDSLLTISITNQIRTQTNFDIPTSVFSSCPTVAQFREYLQNLARETLGSDLSTEETSTLYSDTENEADGTGSPNTSVDSDGNENHILDAFVTAIAEETGLDSDELNDHDAFEDLGIDSIMSIAILGSVRNRTGSEFPTSIFTTHPTLGQLRKSFGRQAEKPAALKKTSAQKKLKPKYSSNSVLLQGSRHSGLPVLFLISDGAGSAASYISIPEFSQKLPVYALESPFLHCPTEFNCSIEDVAGMFITKIREIQPAGPYYLGGWSLGGIYAYEIARQLTTKFNEVIKGITLIDSPCPRPIQMPEPTMELMEQTGIFIGIKRAGKPEEPMPLSQKQHLLSCVKALRVYDPIPMPPEKRPKEVFIIWAKNGLFEKLGMKIKEAEDGGKGGEKVGLTKDWLTAERTSFGPNGWDRLLGEKIVCHAIEGDHFSVMNAPRIKVTGALLQQAVDKFLAY